jgi:hypothetical protein
VEIRGDGHVAPPLHGQEDDLGTVDQPPLGRAGAAQLLKDVPLRFDSERRHEGGSDGLARLGV